MGNFNIGAYASVDEEASVSNGVTSVELVLLL